MLIVYGSGLALSCFKPGLTIQSHVYDAAKTLSITTFIIMTLSKKNCENQQNDPQCLVLFILSGIMLSAIMLSVIIPDVVILSVMAAS